MSGPSLELACFGEEAVALGCDRGVARLELCSHREQDGLTPEDDMVAKALSLRRQGITRLVVMLRPDPLDTDLSDHRIHKIKNSIKQLRNSGVDGFVIGLATAELELPLELLDELRALAPAKQWVFHRLIDRLPNPFLALNTLQALGFRRVLSSGGQATVRQGWSTLMAMQAAHPQLEILAGGGLRSADVIELKSVYPNLALWPRGGLHGSCLASGSLGLDPDILDEFLALCSC